MRQGNGRGTLRKLDCLSKAFRQSLLLSRKPTLMRWPYWHLDLNAGSGWNEEAGCEGTPQAFLRQALAVDRWAAALFCDNDPAACEALPRRLAGLGWPAEWPPWRVVCRDNAEFLDRAACLILGWPEDPACTVGSVLCDANGPAGMPLDALARFAGRFPRVDVMLNANASALAMIEGCRRKPNPRPSDAGVVANHPPLHEALARLSRPHWWVTNNRRPSGTGNRFLILVGRTIDLKEGPTREFVRLGSPAGQDLVRELKDVQVGQQYLF